MQWNIDFDVAALAFLTVLLLFLSRNRRVRMVQNRLFVCLSYLMLASTALDIITAFTLTYTDRVPLIINNILNVLCLLSTQILPIILLMYFFMVLKIYNRKNRKWLWLYCTPTIPALGMILSSPFTKMVFYFDQQMHYVHGPLWGAMFIPSSFVAVISVFYIILYWRRLSVMQNIALLSFDVMIGLGMLLQVLLFEWILLTYFCMSLSLFVIYLALQRQESYLTRMSDMFNADAFSDVYEEAVRIGSSFCLALVEIPDLQRLYAMYGQPLVSELIAHVNQSLSAGFGRDNVFMLSVTRFAVYLKKPDRQRLISCVRELRSGWTIDGTRYCLPCTATMVSDPAFMPSVDELHAYLDLTALMMQENAQAEVTDMSEGIYQRLHRRMDVQRALHHAIEQKTIQLYYQPIYDTVTGRVRYAEALARIQDEKLGLIPACEFIDIAESDGSIVSMTSILFERACQTLNRIGDAHPELERVCFNLSAAQLLQDHLTDSFRLIAQKYGISLNRFAFELTESEPITTSGQIGLCLTQLCVDGAELSLDDFGTGYSNFCNILELSFQTVKIDRSLVMKYVQGGSGFLRHLCDLFHDAGVLIIAEGIEDKQMADELSKIECDMLQGYYLGRPAPEREFIEILSKGARFDSIVQRPLAGEHAGTETIVSIRASCP